MCLAFHWFYLKSRSLLLVYRDAISDSYIFFFFFLAGTYVQLRHHCGRAEKHVVSPVRDFAIRLITA